MVTAGGARLASVLGRGSAARRGASSDDATLIDGGQRAIDRGRRHASVGCSPRMLSSAMTEEPTPLSLTRRGWFHGCWRGGQPCGKSSRRDQDDENTMETRISPLMRGVSSDTVSLCRRTRRSTLEEPSRKSRSITSSRNAGRRGLRSRISPLNGSNSQAERGFQQRERRGAGPGLRRAGDRIERRAVAVLALEAAEQFRQPAVDPYRSPASNRPSNSVSIACLCS